MSGSIPSFILSPSVGTTSVIPEEGVEEEDVSLTKRLNDPRLLKVSLGPILPWAAILRDATLLVEAAGPGSLPPEVGAVAQTLLDCGLDHNGWFDTRSSRRASPWRGLGFFLHEDRGGDWFVWVFVCVYNVSRMNRRDAQYFLEEVVAGSEDFRIEEEIWRYGRQYCCQDDYMPVLRRRMQEFAFWGSEAAADVSLKLANDIIRTNQRVLGMKRRKKETKPGSSTLSRENEKRIVEEQHRKLDPIDDSHPATPEQQKRTLKGPWSSYESPTQNSDESDVDDDLKLDYSSSDSSAEDEEVYWTSDAVGEEDSMSASEHKLPSTTRSVTSRTSGMSDTSRSLPSIFAPNNVNATPGISSVHSSPSKSSRLSVSDDIIREVNVLLNDRDDTSLLTEHPGDLPLVVEARDVIDDKGEEPSQCFFCWIFRRARPSALA